MAISWDVQITPIDVDRKEVSITAVRMDSTDPTKTETHVIASALLVTADQKTAALDNLWQQHLAWQAKQMKIAAYIGTLAAAAKANLEARE
jgi:cytochrome c556